MAINFSDNFAKTLSMGEVAYMKDGDLMRGREAAAVMVESSDDLTALAALVNPGSIAFTAGMGNIWQLKADGTWQNVAEVGG